MKSEFTMMEGGHFKDKGYWYKVLLLLPEISSEEVMTIHRKYLQVKKFSFPTGFFLTRNSIYVNIKVYLFGFGVGLEIQSRK